MNKVKAFTTVVVLLLVLGPLAGQDFAGEKNNRLFFMSEMVYLSGVGNVTFEDTKVSNDGFAARMKLIVAYHINEHFSGGLGVGFDGYFDPAYYILPIFIDIKGYLKDNNTTPFAFLDLGYAPGITDNFGKGLMTNFGIGYRLYVGLGKKALLLPNVGLNLQKIQKDRREIETNQFPPQLVTVEDNITLSSISIGLTVVY